MIDKCVLNLGSLVYCLGASKSPSFAKCMRDRSLGIGALPGGKAVGQGFMGVRSNGGVRVRSIGELGVHLQSRSHLNPFCVLGVDLLQINGFEGGGGQYFAGIEETGNSQ